MTLPFPFGDTPANQAWIGYDGRCPFCRQVVARWRRLYERRGFRFVPLQDVGWLQHPDLTCETVEREMAVWKPGKPLLRGPQAWCYLARRIPWLWPLGVLGSVPGLRRITALLYRWVSRNRHCLGDLCLPDTGTHRRRTTTFLELP